MSDSSFLGSVELRILVNFDQSFNGAFQPSSPNILTGYQHLKRKET
jgi:hypothetical protein